MSTLAEIDMPNALTRYCLDNLQPACDADDNFWQLLPTQQQKETNDRIGYTTVDQVVWTHPVLAKPTSNQLITAYDTWVAATENEIIVATQLRTTDNAELANLLAQAATGLTQIEADIIALQAAATLAAVRPIVDNLLTRQRQIIRTLRGIIRSKLS